MIEKAIEEAKERLQNAKEYLEETIQLYEAGEWTSGERAEWIEDLDYARRGVLIEQERINTLQKDRGVGNT